MKKILFSFIALFTCVFAHSQITDVDGIYYRLLEDTTVANTNGLTAAVFTKGDLDHYKGTITIPSSVVIGSTEYPVTTITELAFRGCRQLTSVSIPASVTRIPSGVFYGCSNLTTITVDAGNTVYDSRDNCNAVVETATNTIIAGCKNTVFASSLSAIGECAFYGCDGISSVIIPENITNVGSWAFLDCTDLLSLTVPSTVEDMGLGVFLGCNKIETLDWNSNYVSPLIVTENAYASLKNVVLGDSITHIGPYAFANCRSLESIILPSNLEIIEKDAFVNCSSLKTVSIPSSIKNIRGEIFTGCDNIETVYWNYNDSIAMSSMFKYAKSSIKKIIIGKDVTKIENAAFKGFENLTSIEVDPDNKVYDSRNNCNAIIETKTASLIIGCKTTTIPNGIKILGTGAFYTCGGPDALTLPSSLLSIGAYAFSGCTGLTSITIPENVSSIGHGVTTDCPNITSITVHPDNSYYNSQGNCNSIINTASNALIAGCKNSVIPAGVTRIDDEAFNGCYGLQSIESPSSVTSIGNQAFRGCAGLTSIDLAGVQTIGPRAFLGCNGLTSVKTPARMESIGLGAFYGCFNLLSFTIPQGIRLIDERVFEHCDTLASIEIPSTVDSIASYAFRNCRSLQSVTIPEGVTVINDETFLGCSSLSYLSIPSTIKEFGRNVYQGCDNLKSAGPKGGGYNYEFNWRDTIPANAFYTLKSLKSVYIPKTVKAVYEFNNFDGSLRLSDTNFFPSAVFHGCDNLESVAVSFTDTKLIRYRFSYYNGVSLYVEFPMDYHLYETNGIKSLTILDDTVKTLSDKLTSQIKEVVISEYVKDIYPGAFSFDPYSVTLDYRYPLSTVNLSSNMDDIVVDNGNTNYTSLGGVLFNKDGSNLIAYPAGRKGAYRIPASAVNITEYSFKNSFGLTSISIPASVNQISDRAFVGCDSLTDVVIDGTPVIGHYAFQGCNNITSVSSRSEVPGLLVLSDSPQTTQTGDCSSILISQSLVVTPQYNQELERVVSSISQNNGAAEYAFEIETRNVKPGTYSVSIGILPNQNNKLNQFSVVIDGYKDNNEKVRIIDLLEEIPYPPFEIQKKYQNDGHAVIKYDTITTRPGRYTVQTEVVSIGYDSVLIADSLVIPDDVKRLRVQIINYGSRDYTNIMLLDRVFFEPLDQDLPQQRYAGPFEEDVFNNATLYVPEGTVDVYRNAEGWKLFKNIAVDTKVYPVEELEVTVTDAGYATFYYSDGDYMLPEGLKAMVISDVTPEGQLIYNTIADGNQNGIIPAGTAVVLATHNKQAGVFRLQLSGSISYDGTNLLIGSDIATTTYAPGNSLFYKLSYGPSNTSLSKVPGWYWAAADGGAFSIEAHKAWLAIPYSLTRGSAGYSLEGNPTNVESVQTGFDEIIIYDLNGRRLNAPSGNGISIRNGQKIIIIE